MDIYCKSCDRTLSGPRAFLRHLSQSHNGIDVFPCKMCLQNLPTKYAYFKHKKLCGKTLPCPHQGCTKLFLSEEHVKRHMGMSHPPKDKQIMQFETKLINGKKR